MFKLLFWIVPWHSCLGEKFSPDSRQVFFGMVLSETFSFFFVQNSRQILVKFIAFSWSLHLCFQSFLGAHHFFKQPFLEAILLKNAPTFTASSRGLKYAIYIVGAHIHFFLENFELILNINELNCNLLKSFL